jgi:hypothetical protein
LVSPSMSLPAFLHQAGKSNARACNDVGIVSRCHKVPVFMRLQSR